MKMMKMNVKMSKMMMKKVSDDDGYLVMKVILWRKLSIDESYLVMKVMIVQRSDDLWRFAYGDVFFLEPPLSKFWPFGSRSVLGF